MDPPPTCTTRLGEGVSGMGSLFQLVGPSEPFQEGWGESPMSLGVRATVRRAWGWAWYGACCRGDVLGAAPSGPN